MPPPTKRARQLATRLARPGVPAALLALTVRPGAPKVQRAATGAALVGVWTEAYRRYRRAGKAQTAREFDLLRTANWEAFWRHYNERVPTIEQEFDIWGEYHQHRHEMRYDLLGEAVRAHLAPGGRMLDLGCGSALVADRIVDLDAEYIGLDFPEHHMRYVRDRFAGKDSKLQLRFVRGDGERMPFDDASFDLVVMSEVIEHLLRPELAVWEVARVLRPGGVFVMTTNNASEVPLRSPISHLFAWLEKAFGAYRPELISLRPWVWPWPVDKDLLPPGSPKVFLPHTHHIFGETREMFSAAGLDSFHFSTFEFPPPQSKLAAWLDKRGEPGRRAVDALEAIAQATPLVRRLGCHMFVVARKNRAPIASEPPPGVWPGPFSNGTPPARSATPTGGEPAAPGRARAASAPS
jgi:ubiquinone/menaquinone biosynthesis C-methylase UbiE